MADREAPRKQRHTAKRVWQRLVDEHGRRGRRDDGARLRARAAARDGLAGRGGVRAAGARAGRRGGGRLGRGGGRARRGAARRFICSSCAPSFSGAAFCQASLGRDAAGVPGGARRGVRVVRRRVRADPLRQPALGGQAGACAAAAGSRATASSRCAPTTCTRRRSRGRGSRARTRRAASRARWAASAATISSRCRRSRRWPS